MVGSPRLPAAGDGGNAAGRSSEATNAGAAIRLTASAQRYAKANGLETALTQPLLGAAVAAGDLVTLETASGRHDFSVAQRRWVVSAGETRLELTLDHPVRRGG
jgi:hypothetical protein